MTAIHEDLLTVLDAVTIASPTRYSVQGWPREVSEGVASRHPTEEAVPMVSAMAGDLYRWLYIRPHSGESWPRGDRPSRREWIAALSRANEARGTWQSGWTIRRVLELGEIVAARFGVDFRVEAGEYRTPDGTAREGGTCRVRIPRERRGLVPGFYFAIGDGGADDREDGDPSGPCERYYWHLTAEGAVPFMATATARLNAAGFPYWLKVPDEPGSYRRADAGLIFLDPRYRERARAAIAGIHADVAPYLRTEVPLFTRRLADGLGFAEDPGNAMSFGDHRCRLAALGLWEAFRRGEHDREARAEALASVFRREGLDPLRPYLGPGGEDEPGLEIRPSERPARHSSPPGSARPPSPLEAAIEIGRAICRSAWWDRDSRLCNWTGWSEAQRTAAGGPITPTLEALGPDLHGGTAGIALFLAHLHERTGDPAFRLNAAGAIANALRLLDRSPTVARLSFFRGHVGVGYAANQVGLRTGSDELIERAHAALDRVPEGLSYPHLLDVMGGNAGAIPALLAMARSPCFERCRGWAIAMAEDLCRSALDEDAGGARTRAWIRRLGAFGRAASRREASCRWEPDLASGPGRASALSSGMAHGAAGIGLALLEAHAASGRPEFLQAARGAFVYEDTLFDAKARNWQDLRLSHGGRAFARGWGHGAPGIALSRLRAAELDPDRRPSYLGRAYDGLATTFDAIQEGLAAPRSDATLANGLCGLLEIVWMAGRMLNEPSYGDWVMDAARTLIARHAPSGDWPSGAASGGANPSMMIGTAGIGYALLRLHDPEHVPSMLWIGI